MSEWKEYKLGNLVYTNTKSIDLKYPYKEIEYLDTGSIFQGKVASFQTVKTKEAPSRARRLVDKDDIIYSTVRPIQKHYGYIDTVLPNLVISTGFVTITCCDKNQLYPKFLYYYLTSDDIVEYLDVIAEASTSAYPSLKPSDIENLDISLPPLPEQQAIASILSSLDDKIDLLQRQNTTLEKMAETLFRQWFVVEAKEEWKEGTIYDLAIHVKKSICPKKKPTTVYYHYSIPSFDDGKNPVKESGNEIQSNKYEVPKNCILFSKLNPHIDKRVWLLQDNVQETSICSTEFQIVKPINRKFLYFLYGWLTFSENYNEIASGVGGTSGSHQRIDPNSIFLFHCPIIPDNYIEDYNFQIEPIFKKQENNQIQIRILTALRNTLLPKLMSGEINL